MRELQLRFTKGSTECVNDSRKQHRCCHRNCMWLFLQNVIAFSPYANRTRTLFWKGTYTVAPCQIWRESI